MKATISIKFLSEREVEERTFTRKIKPYDQFSPLHTKIRKRKIFDNSLTLAIKMGKDERHFVAWEYGGNLSF